MKVSQGCIKCTKCTDFLANFITHFTVDPSEVWLLLRVSSTDCILEFELENENRTRLSPEDFDESGKLNTTSYDILQNMGGKWFEVTFKGDRGKMFTVYFNNNVTMHYFSVVYAEIPSKLKKIDRNSWTFKPKKNLNYCIKFNEVYANISTKNYDRFINTTCYNNKSKFIISLKYL